MLVDEYLTQKDIIGAFFIILGCLVDQLPENAFLAYLKSCMRWPITMYTYMRASCVYDNNENVDEIESMLTLTPTTSDIHIVINDDDEEKMRKNLFMNWNRFTSPLDIIMLLWIFICCCVPVYLKLEG